MTATAEIHAREVATIARALGVLCITPVDPDYDDARAGYNRLHDLRPIAIVHTADPAAIAVLLEWAERAGVVVATRGGGHHIAGFGGCDGGLVIDMSAARSVELDPATGVATVAPGALLADVDGALIPRARVIPTGTVSVTGIAGLTLGGGIGWLAGPFGATCDHLVGADVVLASGRLVEAEAGRDPDLLWALRGSGGGFGVVTRFRYRTHDLPRITTCTIEAPPESAVDAVLALLERVGGAAPVEVTTAATISGRPAQVRIEACAVEGRDVDRWIDDLASAVNGHHVVDRDADFLRWQSSSDAAFLPPRRGAWRARYRSSLSSAEVEGLFETVSAAPDGLTTSVIIEQLHGAAVHADLTTRSLPLQGNQLGVLAVARWDAPDLDGVGDAWVRATIGTLDPQDRTAGYGNYIGADDSAGRRGFAPPAQARLARAKERLDPHDRFRRNHGPRAAGAAGRLPASSAPTIRGAVVRGPDLGALLAAPEPGTNGLLVWEGGLAAATADLLADPPWPLHLATDLAAGDDWPWSVKGPDGVDRPFDDPGVYDHVRRATGAAGAPVGNVEITLRLRDYRERSSSVGGRAWWAQRWSTLAASRGPARELLAALRVMLERAHVAGLELFVEELVAIIAKDPASPLVAPTPTLHSDEHYGDRATAVVSLAEPGWSDGHGTVFLPGTTMAEVWHMRPIDLTVLDRDLGDRPRHLLAAGDVAIYGGMATTDGIAKERGIPHISPDVPGSSSRLLVLMHAREAQP